MKGQGAAVADLTDAERERIDLLRILLVVALVFLHFGAIVESPVPATVGYAGQDFAFASIVVSFLGFLGYTAVPALGVISGFLFFRGADRNNPPNFARLIRRRMRTLAHPFLLWSGAYVVLGYLAFRVSGSFYSGTFAPDDGNLTAALADAWIGARDFPLAVQLWFIRDLLLAVLLSPVIWFLVGRAPVMTLGVLLLLWLAEHNLWIFLKLDVVGFFCLGAAMSMHGWRRDVPRRFVPALILVFLLLVLARAVAPMFLDEPETSRGLHMATCVMRIVGLVSVWSAAPFLMSEFVRLFAARLADMAFFIHCSHYPLILFIKEVLGKVLAPNSSAAHLLLYFVTIVMTFLGVWIAAIVLRTISPGLFAILSGGRGFTVIPGLLPRSAIQSGG